MVICSKAQLLQGFHIRQSMLKDYYVDIVLFGGVQFDKLYAKRLQKFCNHAWFVENNYCTQKEYIKYYLSPRKALKNLINESFEPDYTDIFCWDPGWCFYWLVRNERKSKIKYKWHLIQDGNGNYGTPSLKFEHQHDARNMIEVCNRFIECKVLRIFPKEYDDEYIWKPELRVVPYHHKIVEVPAIDINNKEEISYLNYIFNFDVNNNDILGYKYIFLDTLVQIFYEYTSQIIRELSEKLGGEKIVVFMHPRSDRDMYNDLLEYIELKECKVPWELFFINKLTRDKVILGTYTSALSMGFACCGDTTDVYSFVRMFDLEKLESEGWQPRNCLPMYEKVASFDNHFHIVDSVDELLAICSKGNKKDE